MPRDLPTTAALRAFACAARTRSFKRAAAELHLSSSALSRQIQGLEGHLGVALFRRTNPGLELTDAGRRYLARVDDALARLAEAQDELAPRRPLRVSALESFSESWLVPRLGDFERAHPDVPLELEATLRYADFARDAVDVAIRFGRGPWEGLFSEPLFELCYFPVASPALAAGEPRLRVPRDLAVHTLIHVAQTPRAWSVWLRAAGAPELEPRRAITFDHVSLALAAAEAGQGVALSTPLLCAPRLERGALVRPFELEARSAETYHFVCRPGDRADPRVAAFHAWLAERLSAPDAFRASALAK
ncbi:MAG TPA: transcriptional regulator GcvA [Myxococcota bacterium]|nr:transcriptional regulator GcvA [Myxococcota bacterium]